MTGVLLFFLLSFLSTDDTLSRDECHVARDDYRVIDVSSWIGQDRPWNVRKSFDENRGGLFSPPLPPFPPQFRVNRRSEIAIRCLQGFYCTVETRIELHRHADKYIS